MSYTDEPCSQPKFAFPYSFTENVKPCMVTARVLTADEVRKVNPQDGELQETDQKYVIIEWDALKHYIDSDVAGHVTYTVYWCKLLDNSACMVCILTLLVWNKKKLYA